MRQANAENFENPDASLAVNLVGQYNLAPAKADEIVSLRHLYIGKQKQSSRVCQFIFLAYLRNKALIDKALEALVPRRPKPRLLALLQCASAELIDANKDNAPKVIHYWVDSAKRMFSKNEANFCNAVLRKIFTFFEDFRLKAESFEDLALLLGHPLWLALRWKNHFGREGALEIMRLNQKPAGVYFRRAAAEEAQGGFARLSDAFEPELENGFFKMKSGAWEKVSRLPAQGLAYIQDPSTFRAPALLRPAAGEKILDLCAAPGGKSRAILDLLKTDAATRGADAAASLLVSVDTGKKRLERLAENLAFEKRVPTARLECNLLKDDLAEKLRAQKLPEEFDAALLDAPCSNTGVLGRRPDARWRLKESDISACAQIQLSLLNEAAKFVGSGGRLVYSTCSVDPEENEGLIAKFLEARKDFALLEGGTALPTEHSDGAGAFLLKKG